MKNINIKGPIISNGEKWIYDWFGEDATCPNDIIKSLPEDGSDVTIIVNSGGGYVDSGNEIYTALKSYPGNVSAVVIKAASAASVIAMAANPIRMTPVGQMMLHNVACGAWGDYHKMDKTSEVLQKGNQSLANAYQLKTGKSKEEVLQLMDRETWLTAEEAVELGFADEIMFQEEEPFRLVANCDDLLPPRIIQKMQAMKQIEYLEDGALNNQHNEGDFQQSIEKAVEKVIEKLQVRTNGHKEPENKFSRFLF